MGFDDYWADGRNQLVDATSTLPGWLTEREQVAFLDALIVVEYLSRFADRIAGNPTKHMHREDDPVMCAFGDVSTRFGELTALIRRTAGDQLFPDLKGTAP